MKQRHRKHRRPVRDVFCRRVFREPIAGFEFWTAAGPLKKAEPYTFPVYWGQTPPVDRNHQLERL